MVFAQTEKTASESPAALTIVVPQDSVPTSNSSLSDPEEPKQYLLEGTNPTWLSHSLDKLESFHVWLGGYVQNTGEGIDNYFGTEESFELSKGSRLDIMTPVVFHDSGQIEMQLRLRAKFELPRLRKRWHLFVTSQDSSVKGQANSEQVNEVIEEEGSASFSLQVVLDELKKRELILDFGVNFKNISHLDPYLRLKKRFEWDYDSGWNHRMSHSLFWESAAGPGLESKLVFDKPLDKAHLLRAQSDGVWWQDETYYDLTQRLLLYEVINPYRILTYQTWGRWDTQNIGAHTTGYGLSVNWRERVYKNWLYFEVEPGVKWTENNDFKQPDYTLRLMLEMRFFKKP